MYVAAMSSPKGAAGHVLAAIRSFVASGNTQPSYADLSIKTGYCIQTVQKAIRTLERDHFILIQPGGASRPHHYTIMAPERQRVRYAARLVGLIQ